MSLNQISKQQFQEIFKPTLNKVLSGDYETACLIDSEKDVEILQVESTKYFSFEIEKTPMAVMFGRGNLGQQFDVDFIFTLWDGKGKNAFKKISDEMKDTDVHIQKNNVITQKMVDIVNKIFEL